MAEQEPSILGQLVNSNPVVPPSSFDTSLEQKWLEQRDKTYNPSVLPINPSVNANTIGNIPTGPADPLTQKTGSTENYAKGIVDMINTSGQWANDPNSYSQPFSYGAGWRSGNFERYYSSRSFKKLGYFPGRDNEAVYNENTGFLGDFARMLPYMASLTVDAGVDMASEWGSWGLDDPDTAMAEDFQKAMAGGMSTKGGVGGFVTNLGLNLAYPIGIISEWYAEELVLAGISYLTLGGASEFTFPTMGIRTARATKKIVDSLKDVGKIKEGLKSSYDAVRAIKNVNTAREFMNAAKLNKVANFINPFESTTKFIRNYDKLDGLSNWAKRARGAEALYRDARLINAVTGEAKLEAGFKKIEHTNELINDYYNEHGVLPTGDDLEKINTNAGDAAFYVGLTNIPMIFLTDKIVFDTAFKGSKYLKSPEVVGEELLSKTGEKLIIENGVAKVVKKASIENFKTVFTPKYLASRSMRYLGRNFAQGLQETTQDIIQDTFKDYYKQVYKDPTVASMSSSLGTGLVNQLSSQGFETFLSGFFMGGAMGVVQNALFNGITAIGYKTIAPKKYGEWKSSVDKYVNDFVNFYNTAKTNPNQFSSALRGLDSALVRSKDMAAFADAAGLDNDSVKEVIDAKDEQAFHALIDFIESGHGNHLQTLISDFKNMSNDELAAAFGVDPNLDHAGTDARKRLEVFEKRINLATKLWKDNLRDMPNPIDLKKAQQEGNLIAQGAYRDFENYRKLAVFHFYSLSRALDRQESVYNSIITDSKLGNIPSVEVSPLLSTVGLNQHIDTLKAEIKALKEIDPVEYKKKQNELELYEGYNKLLKNHFELYAKNAELNLVKAELEHGENLLDLQQASNTALQNSKSRLKDAYKNIIKRLAGKYNVPMLDKDIDNAFSMVHDHYLLGIDVNNVAFIADTITNPENMRDLVNRWLPEVRQTVENEKVELLKQGLEDFFGKQALDSLTKKLSTIGVVIPDDEILKLMLRPAISINYVVDITTNKRIPLTEGKGLEAKIIIDNWLQEVNASSETEKPEEAKKKQIADEIGVGPEVSITEPISDKDRISTSTPLAKYPAQLNDLKAKLQTAFEAENKRRKEDREPEISEMTFLEGPIAMDIMDEYYEAKEKKAAPAPAAAAVETPVTPTSTPTLVYDIEAKKADIEKRRKEELESSKKDVTVKIETYKGVYQDTGETHVVTVRTMEDGTKIIQEKVKGEKTPMAPERIKGDQLNLPIENFTTLDKGSLTKISEQSISESELKNKINAKYDAELAALEEAPEAPKAKTTLPINPKYKGSIIYVSPGGGKTTLFNKYNNVVDTDELLAEGMKQAGLNIDSGETIGQAITRHFNTTPDRMSRIYEEVSMNMQNLADLGITVLTGSNRFIPISDHIIITENDERLKANLSGGMSVDAFRAKEQQRLMEPGKAGRTVNYMTSEENLEDILTSKVYDQGVFNPIDKINQSKTLNDLKNNWQEIINHYANSSSLIPSEVDVVYQSKLKALTQDITHQTAEVGSKLKVKNNVRSSKNSNFIEFFAGNIIEVVSKNSKGVYVVKIDSLPTTQKRKPIYLINSRFDDMGASLYDLQASEEVIPAPQAENEPIAKDNKVIEKDDAENNIDLIAERRKKRKQDPGDKPEDAKPC